MSKPTNQNHRQKTIRYLLYSLILLLYLIPVGIVFSHGFDSFFHLFRRIAGLTGIVSLFIGIVMSLLVRQSKKLFGVNYLKIHHFFSISGFILISLHPIIMAIDFGTTRIFIPDFNSWNAFLMNAGRPALYLIYIAVLAAVLRRSIAKYWKYLHGLLYPAFIFGAIHGRLQGSDLGNPILNGLFIAMIVIVILVFISKRYLAIQR